MSSKKRTRRKAISALVLEQGAVTVGSLADKFDVSMQTIRRDVDALCEDEMLHRVHGRIELSREFLNTPFDQRAGTNSAGKRAIAEAAATSDPGWVDIVYFNRVNPAECGAGIASPKGADRHHK